MPVTLQRFCTIVLQILQPCNTLSHNLLSLADLLARGPQGFMHVAAHADSRVIRTSLLFCLWDIVVSILHTLQHCVVFACLTTMGG